MTRKLVIISILGLLLSVMAGVMSPSIEHWWTERGIPPGQQMVKRLSQYYQAELYERALAQAKEERDKAENAAYRPQILYIEWVANRRIGQIEQTAVAKAAFLESYPDHRLAADLHFADAMTLLANSEYEQASEKLMLIERKWPDAKVTVRAKKINSWLKTTNKVADVQQMRNGYV